MGVYNNNKDGTRSTIANTIQVVDAPMEQFVSRGEFNAVVPSDTSADNKLVNDDKFDTNLNDIWKVQGEFGAKNLISYPYLDGDTKTRNGVTFNVDSNGVIRTSGTSNRYAYYDLGNITLPQGSYIFNDHENDNSIKTHFIMNLKQSDGTVVKTLVNKENTSSDVLTFTITAEDATNMKTNGYYILIRYYSGTSDIVNWNNLTFYPMLRLASDTDDTWQPYVPTNRELAKRVDDIANNVTNDMNDIANNIQKTQSILGAKNLLVYPYHGMINGGKGINFIDNNGVITINGISSTTMYYFLELGSIPLKKGKYILSVSNILGNNIYIQMAYNDGIKDNFLVSITRSALSQEFIITDDIISNVQRWWVRIAVLENTQVDNLVVYPMIRYASDTDDTWQPYAPTNYQLNQKLDIAAGVYLPNATTPTSKKVIASVGQTSVTFDANSFMTQYNVTASDLDLDISAETASGNIVAYNNVSVTGGIVTVTFDALAEQTTFICKCSVIQ